MSNLLHSLSNELNTGSGGNTVGLGEISCILNSNPSLGS